MGRCGKRNCFGTEVGLTQKLHVLIGWLSLSRETKILFQYMRSSCFQTKWILECHELSARLPRPAEDKHNVATRYSLVINEYIFISGYARNLSASPSIHPTFLDSPKRSSARGLHHQLPPFQSREPLQICERNSSLYVGCQSYWRIICHGDVDFSYWSALTGTKVSSLHTSNSRGTLCTCVGA